ncbi:Rim1p [Sugiyamaella lignohabitans]|uniref:Rim1p n=1 Tax=Sugiyamaella lignohabitans TaxID=796027 RepID=A0A167FMY4_9ASCO|nr:Rim1p [Sugiyamaella lignohabitans]ANB15494.1 Rim1p [Sugiyamaella lignohabitans]
MMNRFLSSRSTIARGLNSVNSVRNFSATTLRADVARFTAVGRIGADLEKQKAASSETEYLRYPLAVGNNKGETSWFNIVVFDNRAIDFMTKYLHKGSTVFVEADASIHSFTGENGEVRQNLQLIQQSVSPVSVKKRETVEE